MDMQQMFKRLLAGQAEIKAMQKEMLAKMEAKMDSNQEEAEARMEKFEEKMDDYCSKRMAMLDAHHRSIMASLGQTEANTEKTVPDPETIQSAEEH
jgi:TolA-binding protein